MTTPKAVRVSRDVLACELHNYAGRDVMQGEVLYTVTFCTYGCIDEVGGVALSERPGEYPFFEFPRDAVEDVKEG
jgi:hypothetical protein